MLDQTFHTPLPLELEVTIPSGDVELETADGEETHIVVDGDERLLEEVEIRQDGNRVVVAYRGKGKFGFSLQPFSLVFGAGQLKVHATVPHGAAARIKTVSADTAVSGRVGSLDMNSVSGDVRIRGEIAEELKLKTVSGNAHAERVGGQLTAQTVSGDVRVGSVGGEVTAKSVSGDIRIEGVTAGGVQFTSVSGDVEIGIAPGSLLDVDAGSTSGDLSSEVPLASEPVAGESEGPTVVVRGRTISGDFRIFRAA
jgi:Putative adhesin